MEIREITSATWHAALVVRVAAGKAHSCAVVDLTAPASSSSADVNATFTAVIGLTGPTSVAVGGTHACAIVPGNAGKTAVKCWGANDLRQLGTGAAESTPRSMPASVVAGKP